MAPERAPSLGIWKTLATLTTAVGRCGRGVNVLGTPPTDTYLTVWGLWGVCYRRGSAGPISTDLSALWPGNPGEVAQFTVFRLPNGYLWGS